MKKSSKKKLKTASILFISFLIIFVPLKYWLYSGPLTPFKIKVFNSLPFPAVIVNGQIVPMSKFLFRYEVSKKILGSAGQPQKETEVKNNIYYQLIEETKLEQLAKKYRVSLSPKEIDSEYQTRAVESDLQGKKDFSTLLNSYGISQAAYKNEVIKPAEMATNLEIWYNSHRGLNQTTYEQADNLVQRIQGGENMGALATVFSQDDAGKGTEGDLGFVNVSEILPELRQPVESMKLGDVKIIASRYGIHIMRLEEKNDNKNQLRQIFLKNSDFQSWYNGQIKTFNIYKLISL